MATAMRSPEDSTSKDLSSATTIRTLARMWALGYLDVAEGAHGSGWGPTLGRLWRPDGRANTVIGPWGFLPLG